MVAFLQPRWEFRTYILYCREDDPLWLAFVPFQLGRNHQIVTYNIKPLVSTVSTAWLHPTSPNNGQVHRETSPPRAPGKIHFASRGTGSNHPSQPFPFGWERWLFLLFLRICFGCGFPPTVTKEECYIVYLGIFFNKPSFATLTGRGATP